MKHAILPRWPALLVCVAMLLAMTSPAVAAEPDGVGPFVDADGSIHEPDVAAIWAADITAGCGEWRFCPEEPVTRAEMAAFLARALELAAPRTSTFSDTKTSQFAEEIEAIAAAGITRGCGPDRYCPKVSVTRGQMASFLSRAFDLPSGDAEAAFTDVGRSVHSSNIDRLAEAGITHGCDADSYCPGQSVTRAEMAAFLSRALGLEPPESLPTIPDEVVAAYLDEQSGPPWPIGPGAEGWRPLVEMYFEPGDVDRAIRIMACESKGDPGARNPRSGASGLFQHMPRYWPERSSAAGYAGASIYSPEANVAVAAWLVYDYGAGGWHHWVCR